MSGTTTATDTDFVTLTCPDDFVAVRVGFTNINPAPYPVTKVVAAVSPALGDYANPTGSAAWTSLTFAHEGAAVDSVVRSNEAPTAFMVHGNRAERGSSHPGIPRWTWTDWAPLVSVPRTDVPGAPRVIMIRVLLPNGCTYTRPNGGFLDYHLNASMNEGFEYVAGHVPLDCVTTSRPVNAAAAGLGQSKSPVSCVQFLTRNEGIVGVVGGDSHHQGTSTTTQFWNYLLRSIVSLGAQHVGRIPVGYWSTAQGGADSEWFFASLINVLPFAKPSFVVLPGWTFNDTTDSVPADQAATDIFFARLIMTADVCAGHGAVPIFLTPFPRDRDSMTPTQLTPWRSLRNAILSLRRGGADVLDATALLGRQSDGQFEGTFLPQYSDDQIHPNDAGHAVLARELSPVIAKICALGHASI